MYNTKYRITITKTKYKGTTKMLELDYEATITTDERILEVDKVIFG